VVKRVGRIKFINDDAFQPKNHYSIPSLHGSGLGRRIRIFLGYPSLYMRISLDSTKSVSMALDQSRR
jgi:hypothetical protein